MLVLACVALPALLIPIGALASPRAHADRVVLLGLLACIPYAVLVFLALRGHGTTAGYVAVGLICRAALLVPDAGLSEDVWRYVWEGRVLGAGRDPWCHAPDDPVLAALRDDTVHPAVGHREVPSIYPPGSIALFAGLSGLGLEARGFRGAFVVVDLLSWWLLARLLRARGLDPRRAVAWGLSPLVLLEVALGGHLDVLVVPCVLGAFLACGEARPPRDRSGPALGGSAGALLGAGALFKVYAPLLLPFAVPPGRRLRAASSCALVLAAGLVPLALLSGDAPARTGALYARAWSANSPFYAPLVAAAEALRDHVRVPLPDGGTIARAVLLAAFAAVYWKTARGRDSAERRAARMLAALFLLSPVAQPWYLLALVPFLAFEPRPALLLLTGTVVLANHAVVPYDLWGVWAEEPLPRALEFVPVLLWLGVDAARARAVTPVTPAAA